MWFGTTDCFCYHIHRRRGNTSAALREVGRRCADTGRTGRGAGMGRLFMQVGGVHRNTCYRRISHRDAVCVRCAVYQQCKCNPGTILTHTHTVLGRRGGRSAAQVCVRALQVC